MAKALGEQAASILSSVVRAATVSSRNVTRATASEQAEIEALSADIDRRIAEAHERMDDLLHKLNHIGP